MTGVKERTEEILGEHRKILSGKETREDMG